MCLQWQIPIIDDGEWSDRDEAEGDEDELEEDEEEEDETPPNKKNKSEEGSKGEDGVTEKEKPPAIKQWVKITVVYLNLIQTTSHTIKPLNI